MMIYCASTQQIYFISCFDKFSPLKMRKVFNQSTEKSFHVIHLRPKHTNVKVHNGSVVTVPVFDAKSMILDILTNPICMQESNFAPGYNVFTADVDENHDENITARFIQAMHGYLLGINFVIQTIKETTCQLDKLFSVTSHTLTFTAR
jgi:hypothetical protein